MNNPFDYIPARECDEAFRELCGRIDALKTSTRPDDVNFMRELEAGKMLGVLISTDADGVRHTLYAFSGQLGHGGFHFPGFVGPVFDYLQPDGHFKTHEQDISRQIAVEHIIVEVGVGDGGEQCVDNEMRGLAAGRVLEAKLIVDCGYAACQIQQLVHAGGSVRFLAAYTLDFASDAACRFLTLITEHFHKPGFWKVMVWYFQVYLE